MKVTLEELSSFQPLEKVIIQSLDLALYNIIVLHEGEQYCVVNNDLKQLKLHSLMEAREVLSAYHIEEMVMQHRSAYDEMVGQPIGNGNLMEVPIANNLYPSPRTLN